MKSWHTRLGLIGYRRGIAKQAGGIPTILNQNCKEHRADSLYEGQIWAYVRRLITDNHIVRRL
jgi:hypothetical protein